ncbi:MAG: hypothetical protein WCP21_22895 [Armatimonadota bacterium]
MQAEHIDAFLASAFAVLTEEAQAQPDRGAPLLRSGGIRSARELTALVTIEGDLTGVLFYSMSLATADKLRGSLSAPAHGSGGSAQDVLLQTTQAIAAGGMERLSSFGPQCRPGQGLVICGFGELLLMAVALLVVPIFTRYGDMDIGIAVHDTASLPQGLQLIATARAATSYEVCEPRSEEVSAA